MKFYIASPFFTEEQSKRVDGIIAECESFGHKYFSPRDHCLYKPGMDPITIVEDNKTNIAACDAVIAVTNDKDPGTLVEVGWADMMKKQIIFFWEKPPEGMKFNIVLAAVGNCVVTSLNELSDVLEVVSNENMIPYTLYSGDME